ncbi:calpain 8 gene 3 L homeolog [Xenopus laevis]|uniref:Calpain 8 gene 3 L homeolog n=1 Tax=Xenopus laevis TaxID=8355 RepID=Q8AVE8_XENLA|nr:calpain 8 gene 3 L homeolog [Xenopus laevis]AAH42349.1 Capn8-a protein [Xenopus laevis]
MSGIASKVAKDRVLAQGLGTNDKPLKYLNQDYEQLKARCLESNTLFEDETFPASQASMGVKELGPNSDKTKGIVWLRPLQIHPKPEFIISGATRSDVRQGSLGDCWFLSSIASLTLNEEYLSRVVPGDQSFQTNYAGIFHFKFWQYGEWVDVVVDDRLPTKKGKLVFVKSAEGNEFWSALLEKAYAKLNGSYEALVGGSPVDALEDFTGGIAELYYLQKPPADLFQRVQKALRAKSLLTCTSKSDSTKVETVAKNNVVKNHAYTIIRAKEVIYRGEKVQLIRLRNPWGYKEWNGPWSDNACEWDEIDSEVKAALNTQCDDGEVWMSFSDFINEYYRLDICNLSLDCVCSKEERRWCLTQYSGSWKSGCTAGGCKKYPNTFWINPQFWIKLEEPDDDQNGAGNAQCCTVIVGLIQKNRRKMKPMGEEEFPIGYYLYPIPKEFQGSHDVPLGKDFFSKTKYVAWTDVYRKHRETSCRHKLPIGEYIILPHTYYPCQDADFCLRVFSKKKVGALECGDVAVADLYQLDPSNVQVESEIEDILNELEQKKMEMSAEDLRINLSRILSKKKDIKSDGFSLTTCKEMINLFDTDLTGKLNCKEFRPLWIKLDTYMKIFKSVDNDRSDSIEAHEMRNALQQAGFNLNNKIQEAIVQRYISNELSINFDNFIACLIRLENLFKIFEVLKTTESGVMSLSLSEWLCTAMM